MIAERVLNEAQALRLRADLETRLDHSLIMGVAGTEHHSVLGGRDQGFYSNAPRRSPLIDGRFAGISRSGNP